MDATCLGHVDYLQALKYMTLKAQVARRTDNTTTIKQAQ
jgi:hypothetical protein